MQPGISSPEAPPSLAATLWSVRTFYVLAACFTSLLFLIWVSPRYTKTSEEIFTFGSLIILGGKYLFDRCYGRGNGPGRNVLPGIVGRNLPQVEQPVTAGPLKWPTILFLSTTLLASAWSLAPEYSFHQFDRQALNFVIIYFITFNWLNTRNWRYRAYWAFMISGFAGAIYGIVSFYTGYAVEYASMQDKINGIGRAIGPIRSYTRSGMFFVLWLPMALSGVLFLTNMKLRLVLSAGVVLGFWFLLLTQTRGAIGVALLAMVLMAAFRQWSFSIVVLGIITVMISLVPQARSRFVGSVRELGQPQEFFSGRLILWKQALQLIRERPLTGVGYGSMIFYEEELKREYPMINYAGIPDLTDAEGEKDVFGPPYGLSWSIRFDEIVEVTWNIPAPKHVDEFVAVISSGDERGRSFHVTPMRIPEQTVGFVFPQAGEYTFSLRAKYDDGTSFITETPLLVRAPKGTEEKIQLLGNFRYMPSVHSFYLQTATEGGIIHLTALLLCFGTFLVWMSRALVKVKQMDPLDSVVIVGAFYAGLFLFLFGLVIDFHETRIANLLWGIMGLGLAAAVQTLREKAASEKNGAAPLGPHWRAAPG